MRIGLFGGSFDPVHLGHLLLASEVLDGLSLDHVRWIPAAQSPLKPAGPVASGDARLAMLRLACDGTDGFQVDPCELHRRGVSYTLDTVTSISEQFPDADLYLLMGADSLASIAQWRSPEKILKRCTPVVLQRPGYPEIDYSVLEPFTSTDQISQIRKVAVQLPQIEISSSEIRQRVADKRPIRFHTSAAVEAFIVANQLYRAIEDPEQ